MSSESFASNKSYAANESFAYNELFNLTLDDLLWEPEPASNPAVLYIWIIGLAISTICLLLQLVLFKIRPKIRKMDQKILTQLTVARLLNSVFELLMSHNLMNEYTLDLTFALYIQTDAAMICWMFVYTKSLYDKVVLVFALQKLNFILMSALIWILTIPIGVMCPVFLNLEKFIEFYHVYAWFKFVVLTVNILFFGRIFYVIMTRNKNSSRNFTEIIKTCVISFILVCLTSLQVFINDILSYFEIDAATDSFCVLNSFQPVAATIIFLILAKNNIRQ